MDTALDDALAMLASPDTGERRTAWFAVADSCNGAADDHRSRIWNLVQPFASAERSTEVGLSLVHALQMIQLPEAASTVMAWVDSPVPEIREEVTQALCATAIDPPEASTVEVLLALSRDPDDDVRDWATFALGSQLSVDSETIRDALAERLSDPYFDCMHEGLVGLARLRDGRALEPTRSALEGETVHKLAVESAVHLGDPLLLPALLELRSWWDLDPGLLDRAIERCDPEWCRERAELCAELTGAIMRQASLVTPRLVGLEVVFGRDWYDGDDEVTVTHKHRPGGTAACEYSLPALLRRAGGSLERAATFVLGDLTGERSDPHRPDQLAG